MARATSGSRRTVLEPGDLTTGPKVVSQGNGWSDPWYGANARLAGVPTCITYVDQKEVARVGGRESVAVLDARLPPTR
jgi:hypothetical protein